MASMNDATVTERHPKEFVDTNNHAALSKGHVVNGSVCQDGGHLMSDLAVDNGDVIRKIDLGELCELSPGYVTNLDETPGVVPEGEIDAGQPYDRVQGPPEYNHVAIGPKGWGRGGPSVSIRLDDNGDVCLDENDKPEPATQPRRRIMRLPKIEHDKRNRTVRIDGVTYSLKTAEGRQQVLDATAALKTRIEDEVSSVNRKDEGDVNSAMEQMLKMLIAMQQTIHELMAAPAPAEPTAEPTAEGDGEGETPKDDKPKMDSLVEERTDCLSKARSYNPKYDPKGKSNVQIMRDTIAASNKTIKLDGRNDDEIRGMFMMLPTRTTHPTLAKLATANGGNEKTDGGDEEHIDGGETDDAQKYRESAANLWKVKRK